jgi:DNA-binding response OmpR family regulator
MEAALECPRVFRTPRLGTRLLLVGSYQLLLKPLKRALEEEGFFVDVGDLGSNGSAAVPSADYDGVILDLARPAGATLVERWREAGVWLPVFVLMPAGVSDRPGDVPSAIDDWLAKPFDLEELLGRLRAWQRKARKR